MRLSFAWWNSSLSPLGKSRATNEQKSIALAVVRYLTEEVKVDCLALGEVTYDDLIAFKSELELQDYEIIDGTLKKERLNFDTGVIYRKSSLYFVSQESITINRSNHHLKLANKLKFLMPFCDSPLYLFVSHWPSRLWCQVNGADWTGRLLVDTSLRIGFNSNRRYLNERESKKEVFSGVQERSCRVGYRSRVLDS